MLNSIGENYNPCGTPLAYQCQELTSSTTWTWHQRYLSSSCINHTNTWKAHSVPDNVICQHQINKHCSCLQIQLESIFNVGGPSCHWVTQVLRLTPAWSLLGRQEGPSMICDDRCLPYYNCGCIQMHIVYLSGYLVFIRDKQNTQLTVPQCFNLFPSNTNVAM